MSGHLHRIRQLVRSRKTVLLASADENGEPLASYAPFWIGDGAPHVLLSRLARHHRNLEKNPRVSILFIEDEADSPDLFARRRLEYRCRCETVERDSDTGRKALAAFRERFGETFALIESLPDFTLFRLTPLNGNYVEGFGRAYTLDDGGALRFPSRP